VLLVEVTWYDPWIMAGYRDLRARAEESGLQRVAVAERDGAVVGVVTLEGEPPGART
jgi:nucleotide-binding universal stress UspA family protein